MRKMLDFPAKYREMATRRSRGRLQCFLVAGSVWRIIESSWGSSAVAKPLIFQFGERELAFTLNKVDRSKLYGYKEMQVLDEEGQRCELATLADDGCTVVGRGGTGIGQLSVDGLWCDKKALKPVDQDGKEFKPVPSSFNAPIRLSEKAPISDYLNHNIRLLYHLTSEDDVGALLAELQRGTVFSFPYSYRGGLAADAGFLLLGEEDKIFLAVGNPTRLEFIGLQQLPVVEEEASQEEEADSLDFDMI